LGAALRRAMSSPMRALKASRVTGPQRRGLGIEGGIDIEAVQFRSRDESARGGIGLRGLAKKFVGWDVARGEQLKPGFAGIERVGLVVDSADGNQGSFGLANARPTVRARSVIAFMFDSSQYTSQPQSRCAAFWHGVMRVRPASTRRSGAERSGSLPSRRAAGPRYRVARQSGRCLSEECSPRRGFYFESRIQAGLAGAGCDLSLSGSGSGDASTTVIRVQAADERARFV